MFVKLLFWNVYLFNCSPPSFSPQRKRDRWGTHEILCICKNNGNNNNNSSNTGRHFIASLPYARLSMILPILTHLILIITLRGRIDYYLYFPGESFHKAESGCMTYPWTCTWEVMELRFKSRLSGNCALQQTHCSVVVAK